MKVAIHHRCDDFNSYRLFSDFYRPVFYMYDHGHSGELLGDESELASGSGCLSN